MNLSEVIPDPLDRLAYPVLFMTPLLWEKKKTIKRILAASPLKQTVLRLKDTFLKPGFQQSVRYKYEGFIPLMNPPVVFHDFS